MIAEASIVLGLLVTVLFASWLVGRVRGPSGDRRESRKRHEAATEREPPVDIGDVRTVAIEEFTTHHSGERHAVCKVEGFVVFVEDLPDGLEETDVIGVKVLSFNRGHTSASARFLERA
ncbi:TRAM domain-containing protein [Halosolutus gelatinilyticus]|uniref:TRAM domain-containing protein n=1 Tax=Halosolutus gelatinilyticus TaxID=2931975 RepID=UPI001FF5C04D|nr:RNA-binding protein [Halosolutus gelatinilyticus]